MPGHGLAGLGRVGPVGPALVGAAFISSSAVIMRLAGTAAGTSEERAAALTQQLNSRLETIELKLNSIAVEDANFDQFSRAWELRDVMATSIKELLLDIATGTPAFDPSEK